MHCSYYLRNKKINTARCQRPAVGHLTAPDGFDAGRVCQKHADEITTEYREKLGEQWTIRPLEMWEI